MIMKLRRSMAIFKKQIFDTAYNRSTLIQFLIFPLMTLIFQFAPIGDGIETKMQIVMLMSSVFTGMIPIIIINNIIQEDKRTGAMRMLILANVKPIEYLIGVTLYIVCISFLLALLIGVIAGLAFVDLLYYVACMLLGIVTTLILGSAVACQAGNSAYASLFVTLLSMVNGFLPIFTSLYPATRVILRYWYTQQVTDMIGDIADGYFLNIPNRLFIVGVHLLLFLVLFFFSFRHNKMIDKY